MCVNLFYIFWWLKCGYLSEYQKPEIDFLQYNGHGLHATNWRGWLWSRVWCLSDTNNVVSLSLCFGSKLESSAHPKGRSSKFYLRRTQYYQHPMGFLHRQIWPSFLIYWCDHLFISGGFRDIYFIFWIIIQCYHYLFCHSLRGICGLFWS